MDADIMGVETMKKILLAIISVLLISCDQDLVYTEFASLPAYAWQADSLLIFSPMVNDSVGTYDLQMVVRHTDKYAYQNLWLFVQIYQDSILLRSDTINGMLADGYGKWYGKGMHMIELPLFYLEDLPLDANKKYMMVVQQGMREDLLQGISDIGLKVIKHGKE